MIDVENNAVSESTSAETSPKGDDVVEPDTETVITEASAVAETVAEENAAPEESDTVTTSQNVISLDSPTSSPSSPAPKPAEEDSG